jgi:NinB protein
VAERLTLPLWNAQQGHQALLTAWRDCIKPMLMAGHRMTLEAKPEKRSDPQNRRLWAMLTEVSKQVEWYGQTLSPEDWKHIFTASLQKTRAVPGIDGGIVVLGQSTSRMTKAEMCDLQTLIEAFAAERGVLLGVDMETGEIR